MKTNTPSHTESSPAIRSRSAGSFGIRPCLLLLIALSSSATAQIVAPVPGFVNYQGRVTDAAGLPIGATGTPAAPIAGTTNRKIIFRIFDASSGGTRLWTEEQTVTISTGEFSVLLGNGINPTGTAAGELRPALDTVFTTLTSTPGTARFLEVMVDEGGGTIDGSDVPISPRQQLTTTAYAFRARAADTIAGASDLTINPTAAAILAGAVPANYGLGWYGNLRTFNGTAINGPVLYGFDGGALGSVNGGNQVNALRWNASGQVGIGTTTMPTGSELTLQGDDASAPPLHLNIRGTTDTNKRLLIGYNTTGNYGAIQAYNGASTATNLVFNEIGGNVGIGNSAPDNLLAIGANINTGNNLPGISLGAAANRHVTLGQSSTNNVFLKWGYNATPSNAFASLSTYGGSNPLVLQESGGNVGIGTTIPAQKLDVIGGTQSQWLELRANNGTPYIDFSGTTAADYHARIIYLGTNDNRLAFEAAAFTFVTGNVGIGTTTTPEARLHVVSQGNGSGNNTAAFSAPNIGVHQSHIHYGTTGNWLIRSASTAGTVILQDSGGNVGIGTGSPNAKLHVMGGDATQLRLQTTGSPSNTYWNMYTQGSTGHLAFQTQNLGVTALLTTAGAWTNSSDSRLKFDVTTMDHTLEQAMKLRPVSYRLKALGADSALQIGFIAQEVQKIAPEVVIVGDKGMLSLAYGQMMPIAIGAVQQLKKEKDAEVKALKNENAELWDENKNLKARLTALEAKDQARDAKLAAIEKLLLAGDRADVKPVSLKKSVGGAE